MVGELQVPRAAQQFTSVAAKVREAEPDLVFIASFGAQQDQIVKQLRDNGVTQQLAELFGVLLADGHAAARGQGRAVPDPVGGLDSGRHERAGRQGLEGQDRQGAERLRGQLLQCRDGVRAVGAGAWKRAGQPITGENLLEQRKANGSFDLVGGKMDVPAERHGRRCRSRSTRSTAPAPASWSRPAPWRSSARSPSGCRRAAAPTPHQRAAARGDLRADCGRLLADLRRHQDLPRRARRGLHDRRLPLLVVAIGAGPALAGRRAGRRWSPRSCSGCSWSASSTARSSGTRGHSSRFSSPPSACRSSCRT